MGILRRYIYVYYMNHILLTNVKVHPIRKMAEAMNEEEEDREGKK